MNEDIRFDWDDDKNLENAIKHGVSFSLAQQAFLDPYRVIVEDRTHSIREDRHFCLGRVGDGIITVRFTFREDFIRIFGAGYWRKGKRIYERKNRIQGRP